MKIHASGEDYLEAVLILQKKQGMVRSIDLARHMGFSKPSISHAVGVLRDGREFDEYIAFTEGVGAYSETLEEYLCRKETWNELLAVLTRCIDTQQRRFLLYALDGLTLAEIGTVCGCSKVSVHESIDAVRKKFLKFFANYPNE